MDKAFNKKFIKTVAQQVERLSVRRMDSIALRAHSRLVTETPVDLGQARAGWNFSANQIDNTTPPKPTAKTKTGKTKRIPAPTTKLPSPKVKVLGDAYHISNFVGHIIYLNEGTSEQAGANFVEAEIAAAVRDVEQSL